MTTETYNNSPALVYNGEILHAKSDMLSLTDMWKADGADPARKPAEWLRSADAQRFIEFLAETHNMGNSHLFKTTAGRNGATWAHWQIALAYAKYLSPEFHGWCNKVVRERMEGRSVALSSLPAELEEYIRRTDGISRMLAHKVTGIEQTVSALTDQVNNLLLAADGRVAALEYVSVRELLDEAKALQKRRGSLNRKVGYEMRQRALLSQPPVPLRRCPHSGVWLYPRDFAALYMAERGNMLVHDHNARVMGQGVLQFPRGRYKEVVDAVASEMGAAQ